MKWNMVQREARGFTLIELLIVVAIIAILAAIAVPNFLEAQLRSKVARVKADMRTQAIAEETYMVDYNTYTKDNEAACDVTQTALTFDQRANGVLQLTTPIAYMTSLLTDPFQPKDNSVGAPPDAVQGYRIASGAWSYPDGCSPADEQDSQATRDRYGNVQCFLIFSPGPDKTRNRNSYKCFPWRSVGTKDSAGKSGPSWYEEYDPTNGTVSAGDIHQFGGNYMAGNWDHWGPNSGH